MDLFGGIRRSVEAAQANLEAGEEDLRDVLVSLLAETALNYVEVRTFQARLAAAEASLKTQEETYQLTLWRSQAGLGDELDVQQARYNLENTRVADALLRTGLQEAMNRIAVLLGETPGSVHAELEKPEPIPVPPSQVAVGIPADIVRRRPDIRRAERELAAQTARVGVATADLYPRLILNGSVGLETLSLGDPDSGSWLVSGGPRLSPADLQYDDSAQYRSAVGFAGAGSAAVRDHRSQRAGGGGERPGGVRAGTAAARQPAGSDRGGPGRGRPWRRTSTRPAWRTSPRSWIAERSLLQFRDQLNQSDGTVTSNLIRLYKALGGGWTRPPHASPKVVGRL